MSEGRRDRVETLTPSESGQFFSALRARLRQGAASAAVDEPPAAPVSPEAASRVAAAAMDDQATRTGNQASRASPSAATPTVTPTDETLAARDELDSHRLEIHRLAAEVRRLEGELRAERHEHAETRQRLARHESDSVSPALARAFANLSRAASVANAHQTAQQPRTRDLDGEVGADSGATEETHGRGNEGVSAAVGMANGNTMRISAPADGERIRGLGVGSAEPEELP